MQSLAKQVKHVLDLGVQVGVVIGGSNFFRVLICRNQAFRELLATIWVCWLL